MKHPKDEIEWEVWHRDSPSIRTRVWAHRTSAHMATLRACTQLHQKLGYHISPHLLDAKPVKKE